MTHSTDAYPDPLHFTPPASLSVGRISSRDIASFYPPLSLTRGFLERRYLPQLVPKTRWHMIQSFREQAERAERLAKSIDDARTRDALMNYARECREKMMHVASAFAPSTGKPGG